jgi:nitroreductase
MNETIETIHGLRSTHGDFSARQVSDEDPATILDASVQAANASARQSYSIVVLDDPETMHKLTGYRAARMLLYCVDFNRVGDTAEHLGPILGALAEAGFPAHA